MKIQSSFEMIQYCWHEYFSVSKGYLQEILITGNLAISLLLNTPELQENLYNSIKLSMNLEKFQKRALWIITYIFSCMILFQKKSSPKIKIFQSTR